MMVKLTAMPMVGMLKLEDRNFLEKSAEPKNDEKILRSTFRERVQINLLKS